MVSDSRSWLPIGRQSQFCMFLDEKRSSMLGSWKCSFVHFTVSTGLLEEPFEEMFETTSWTLPEADCEEPKKVCSMASMKVAPSAVTLRGEGSSVGYEEVKLAVTWPTSVSPKMRNTTRRAQKIREQMMPASVELWRCLLKLKNWEWLKRSMFWRADLVLVLKQLIL
jgi:hypothetical protein